MEVSRTASRRLREVFAYAPTAARFAACEHRDARNGHAHLNPKKLKKSPQLHDLYTHTKTVQLLCYGALCMRIGLSAKDALDSLIKSRYMWSSVEQSRKYYAQESISVLGEQHDSEWAEG